MNILPENRRPISFRKTAVANKIAQYLAAKKFRPNQISLLSVVFAAVAAMWVLSLLYLTPRFYPVCLIAVIIFITLRLLCNLFDGMLAIEGGHASRVGEIYNDLPDRCADTVILLSLGYASMLPMGITLAWLASILAIMTAYVRVLGFSVGAKQYFLGPMAKQHRMALVIIACFLSIFIPISLISGVFIVTLSLICMGSLFTIYRRLKFICIDLE